MVTIIDYQVGNVGSIQNMLRKIGVSSVITSDKKIIEQASKLILPGVGAFDYGMKKLYDLNIIDSLNELVFKNKIPVLGICLGAQLMTKRSEEGKLEGLGWINAETIKFKNLPDNFKIPHMGWANLKSVEKQKIFLNTEDNQRYYFVHSYFFSCFDEKDKAAISKYGHDFVAAFEKENICGVQFHPEKSHKYGLKIFENFMKNY